ncbi:MAG: DoxX family membrane protein [Chloroflexi bacterium]|nr:DoxX family membrane protein [Chloroflexota bacterium]
MNTLLWIVQILLALAFLAAGLMKATQPIDRLKERMTWVESINPPSLVRVIGVLEILGAIGLILPALTGILPWLTPVAAGGLVLTMIGALALHLRRQDEIVRALPSLVLLLLAAFVIYGRAVAVPLV